MNDELNLTDNNPTQKKEEKQMNETNQAPTEGTKLSTIFMVVLGLHIVVIVVITAFYFMKGRPVPEMVENSAPSIAEGSPVFADHSPSVPALQEPEPLVETSNAPRLTEEIIGNNASGETPLPMPASASEDWTRAAQAPLQPAHDIEPAAGIEPDYGVAPARLEAESKSQAFIEPPVRKVPAQVVAAPAKARSYTVVAGDNLTKIAKKNGTTVAKLKKANGLSDDILKIGQVLKVPGAAAPAAVAKSAEKKAAPAPAVAAGSYTVVSGDNLTKIARRSGTTVAELKKVNGLTSDDLKVGAVLKLPRSAATKAAPKPAPVREAEASVPVKKPFRAPTIPMDVVSL